MEGNIMTFEDFEKRATIPQKYGGKTIFEIVCWYINNAEMKKTSHYPKYEVYNLSHTFCKTLEEAENLVAVNSNVEDLFCTYIYEYPLDSTMLCTEDAFMLGECLSWWVFGTDGNLIEQSVCPNLIECSHFYGRLRSMAKFKPGEVVEIRRGQEVSLGVILRQPMDVEQCWHCWNKSKEALRKKPEILQSYGVITDDVVDKLYPLDSLDDEYMILKGPDWVRYSNTAHPGQIFKPHFTIPDNIRKRVESWYESVINENMQE